MSNKMPRFVIEGAIKEAQVTTLLAEAQLAATEDPDRMLSLMECIRDARDAIQNMQDLLDATG